jgi:DNA-binding MurR/RpiR family transcriptional regulator
MNENVLQTIRAGMDTFSKGQKRIAAFILDNYDRAAFMTAARLGETASVSESTVVRFAAQLGYDGYPEMQKALQELIRGKLTSIQRIQVSRDQMSGADILGSVMQRDMNSIHNVIEQLDRDAFSRAVDKLLGAEHIYILGVRSSSFLAGYLNFYLHLIFKNVTLVQSSAAGEIYEQLAHIGRGDVLVGISFPRYSKMAIHAVEFACRRGAEVVAITDSALSPLYGMAAVSLLEKASYSVLEREDKPTSSKPGAPFITSTLQQAASTRLGFGVKKTMMMAQRLYEAGHITYMRTDSTNLSQDALNMVRGYISDKFGKKYLPDSANQYASKENSQEAHEAIRPSDVNVLAETLKDMEADAQKLYQLIWRQSDDAGAVRLHHADRGCG